jgi:hypothetical protein
MSTTLAAMMEAFFILSLLCKQEIHLLSDPSNVAMTNGFSLRQAKAVSAAMMRWARPLHGRTKLPKLSQRSPF